MRTVAISRRPRGTGEGNPLRHPNVLHVGFWDAWRGAAVSRECHAEFFFLAWGRPRRGSALVAWSSVCRPFADGGLNIHHLQHANSALLCKWIARVMQPSDDLISPLLREAYGPTLDRGKWATPRHGDSPIIAGLRGIFPLV